MSTIDLDSRSGNFFTNSKRKRGPNTATCDISLVLLLEGLNCDRLDSHKLFLSVILLRLKPRQFGITRSEQP